MNITSLLIVEDNAGDVLLIREYLAEKQNISYDIKEAGSLETGLNLMSHHDFDLILLDLSLPDSTGLETVRQVVTRFPEIAVIILTGLQDEETALQAVRYGAQDYLEKQALSPVILHKAIAYAIERKKVMQEKEDLLQDLTKALERIENLEGILPICVSCKKICDADQHWVRLQDYIKYHADVEIVQLICPICKNEFEQEHQS
jgi:DNA-binding NarL/FixJ family response regulator